MIQIIQYNKLLNEVKEKIDSISTELEKLLLRLENVSLEIDRMKSSIETKPVRIDDVGGIMAGGLMVAPI